MVNSTVRTAPRLGWEGVQTAGIGGGVNLAPLRRIYVLWQRGVGGGAGRVFWYLPPLSFPYKPALHGTPGIRGPEMGPKHEGFVGIDTRPLLKSTRVTFHFFFGYGFPLFPTKSQRILFCFSHFLMT